MAADAGGQYATPASTRTLSATGRRSPTLLYQTVTGTPGFIAALVISLRAEAGRLVVDKTGLPGSYHVRLTFDSVASRLSPDAALLPDAGLTVIDAVQQQLGLRLRSSWADQDTLVVDRIERPTEN